MALPLGAVNPSNPTVYLDIEDDGNSIGRIVVELKHDVVPLTAAHFMELVRAEDGGYKGTKFHRILRNYMAVGGETNGEVEPFADENFTLQHAGAGVLSMANSGKPHTNKSQFFMTFTHTEWLDRKNVAFAQIVEGHDVLRYIESAPVRSLQGVPLTAVTIADCGVMHEGAAAAPSMREPEPEGSTLPMKMVAVAGPSGVGKGTLIGRLTGEFAGKLLAMDRRVIKCPPPSARAHPQL
jgi:cyclophilin family peptidyl-prolyl cis-trans isomerase